MYVSVNPVTSKQEVSMMAHYGGLSLNLAPYVPCC